MALGRHLAAGSAIEHVYNDVLILQRADGYFNASSMCKANGKLLGNYLRNDATKEFLAELSSVMRISITDLVQPNQGGIPILQGTWVHQRVAIDLARWCSARFAVKVNGWIEELLTKGRVEISPSATPKSLAWSERMSKSFQEHKLYINEHYPFGSFSVYTETATDILIIEDELNRHNVPMKRHDLPDGSIGRHWALGLKATGGGSPIGRAPLHMHHIERDNWHKVVEPFVYPGSLIPQFRQFLYCDYIPRFMPQYFANKPEWQRMQLALASAADGASKTITGRPAQLDPALRKMLDSVGGFAPIGTTPTPKLTY